MGDREPHDIGSVANLTGNSTRNSNGSVSTVRLEGPAVKRSKTNSIDVKSSRDLKLELRRINSRQTKTSFNRKNLLRKSVPNLSVYTKDSTGNTFNTSRKVKNAMASSFDTRRIRNVMKNIFHSSESDDD